MMKKEAMTIEDQMLCWDTFLASPHANSAISSMLHASPRAKVVSKPIAHTNPNTNQMISCLGPKLVTTTR